MPELTKINREDLATTWRTLRLARENWNIADKDGAEAWEMLVDAQRLIEMEMRAQGFDDLVDELRA